MKERGGASFNGIREGYKVANNFYVLQNMQKNNAIMQCSVYRVI